MFFYFLDFCRDIVMSCLSHGLIGGWIIAPVWGTYLPMSGSGPLSIPVVLSDHITSVSYWPPSNWPPILELFQKLCPQELKWVIGPSWASLQPQNLWLGWIQLLQSQGWRLMDSLAPPLWNNLPQGERLARSGNSSVSLLKISFEGSSYMMLMYHFTILFTISNSCCFIIF